MEIRVWTMFFFPLNQYWMRMTTISFTLIELFSFLHSKQRKLLLFFISNHRRLVETRSSFIVCLHSNKISFYFTFFKYCYFNIYSGSKNYSYRCHLCFFSLQNMLEKLKKKPSDRGDNYQQIYVNRRYF